jgi:hypothetical protein
VCCIRASQGDEIDFAGSSFKKRKPRTRDGTGLNPGALLVRKWKGKLERVIVLDKGFAWNGDLWQPFPSRQGCNRHELERAPLFRLAISEGPELGGIAGRPNADQNRCRRVPISRCGLD